MKPEDIPKILDKIRDIKLFITKTKQEIISHIDPDFADTNEQVNKINTDEMEQINFYLARITNLDHQYNGEYSLRDIKDYYQQIIAKKIKIELNK
ncbi:MAG: DUF2672 domain-containing protein [Rickettsiaceae bacterium]